MKHLDSTVAFYCRERIHKAPSNKGIATSSFLSLLVTSSDALVTAQPGGARTPEGETITAAQPILDRQGNVFDP